MRGKIKSKNEMDIQELAKDEPVVLKSRRFLLLLLALMLSVCFAIFLIWSSWIDPQTDLVVTMIEDEQGASNQHTNLYYKDADTGEWRLLETLYDGEQREWVSYKNIPVHLRNAAVAIEDKRFWDHDGVDWYRTAGAIVNSVKNKLSGSSSLEGGSTITQQMIKNVTGNDDVSVKRKLFEIVEALKLEEKLSKEQIMEMYLNHIYFGRNSYGIYSASYTYFGKSVLELDLAECATLISITNNPSYYDPYRFPEHTLKRAKRVLLNMYEQDYVTQDELREALLKLGYSEGVENVDTYEYHESDVSIVFKDGSLKALIADGGDAADNKYNWFTDAVIESLITDLQSEKGMSRKEATEYVYHGGLEVYTTFDPAVQAAIDMTYCNGNYESYVSEDGSALQSGMCVINNQSGAVVGIAGGFGVKDGNRLWNRAIHSKLAPASTLKTLAVYIPMLDADIIDVDSMVDDVPFSKEYGKDYPSNDYDSYYGRMSLRDAVAYSTNTVPMHLLKEYGLDKSYDFLVKQFGLDLNEDHDKNYASLGLGGLTDGVSVQDMTAGYATIPMDGNYVKPYYYTLVEDCTGDVVIEHDGTSSRIYKSETADKMHDLLSGVVEYGTGLDAVCSVPVVGKTGTSNDNKDFWFCGYNNSYTASVWCGYDKSQTIPSDENVAVSVWHDVMEQIIQNKHLE